MSETIYLPGSSVKQRDTQFGTLFNLSFKVEELGAFCKKHKNEKGYINLVMSERKEVGQYGDTHSIKLDTWKPNEKGADKPAAKKSAAPAKKTAAPAADPLDDAPNDDIPF